MSPKKHRAEPDEPEAAGAAETPAAVIRSLLRRDYSTSSDWQSALRDFAQVAKAALRAGETMVALYSAEQHDWSACTSDGTMLSGETIGLYGSLSVLQKVRKTGTPILTTLDEPLLMTSESIAAHELHSVLAVPLYFWDVHSPRAQRSFGGCLYAHRSSAARPFSKTDVELIRDLTELAQRTLNVLTHMRDSERHLRDSEPEPLRSASQQYRLGRYETQDPWFSQHVLEPLRRVSYANRINLLILGPSGSGKSYLAQAYHYECPRRDRAFVVLDCSQVLSAETLGPELFGYARDSGYANAPKKGLTGKAELADRGTLFIDEVATLPGSLQQKLLRLIQSGRFSPLGSSEEKTVDIQVIAATNEDLAELVRQGRFREDLYQRLRELTVLLPPLNRRAADIQGLAAQLLTHACERFGRTDVQCLGEGAIKALTRHDWSQDGNIRGLEYTVNRSVLLAPRGTRRLEARHLEFGDAQTTSSKPPSNPPADLAPPAPASAPHFPAEPELTGPFGAEKRKLRAFIETKIQQHEGVLAVMAADPEVVEAWGERRVPMPLSTLRLRVRRLGLDGMIARVRRRRNSVVDSKELVSAIRQYRSGTAAAEALGMTRDSFVWHLRKAGLSVRGILADPG